MLDDRKDVDHVSWCFAATDKLAVLPLDVVVLVAPPHQAQSAAYRLFQKDAGGRCTEWDDDADVVDVKSFAQHQHAHDHAWRLMPINVKQPLAKDLPFVGL